MALVSGVCGNDWSNIIPLGGFFVIRRGSLLTHLAEESKYTALRRIFMVATRPMFKKPIGRGFTTVHPNEGSP